MTTSAPSKNQWRNLIAACAAIAVFGFAFGMSYPLLSLLLEKRGVSPEMIGINAAMAPIGILLFSPVMPLVAHITGVRSHTIVNTANARTEILWVSCLQREVGVCRLWITCRYRSWKKFRLTGRHW